MGAWDIMGREYDDEATVGAALQERLSGQPGKVQAGQQIITQGVLTR